LLGEGVGLIAGGVGDDGMFLDHSRVQDELAGGADFNDRLVAVEQGLDG
jgi:hypothetical protein